MPSVGQDQAAAGAGATSPMVSVRTIVVIFVNIVRRP
jgi:hypothetical protein